MSVTLLLGGARSGKSAVAERRAGDGPVTYLATFTAGADDRDMAARVAAHQARRPATWTTVETSDLVGAVRGAEPGTLLVDSLTTWVAGATGFAVDAAGLCLAMGSHDGDVIVVSDEVGLGVHPSTEEGRRFRDALGMVNQAVSAVADEALLVVAGRVLRLDPRVMRRALSFLTPMGGAVAPSPAALAWFPVVGAMLGLLLGGMWWLADRLWVAPVAAAVVVAADLALTGMLHFDGLVDSADGLLPPLEKGRRLEVMADPAAGAFGVGAGVAVLLLRWASLAALAPAPWLLAALWCGSRLVMAGVARSVPYARPGGLAGAFIDGGRRRVPVAGVLLLGLLAVVAGGDGVAGVLVLVVIAGAVVALAVRRLGGFTGDVLGAAGVVGETAGLLAAAARL